MERCREILTEVHCEVSEILHHDGIVFRSELANHLQLLLSQTDPRGVVGIGIDDGADVALLEIALEFRTEFISTIGIDIEGLILHAHHLQLHLLNRKARVDKEHGILRLVALRTGEERGESALHRTTYGNTTFGLDVDADECLHKLRGGLFEHRRTLNIGIAVGDTILQCLNLGIDSDLAATCFTSRIVALEKSLIPSSATRPSTISFFIGVSITFFITSELVYRWPVL